MHRNKNPMAACSDKVGVKMSKFNKGDWVRTCQECGNVQKAVKPDTNKELTNSYSYSKCRKCKSEALDYGKEY